MRFLKAHYKTVLVVCSITTFLLFIFLTLLVRADYLRHFDFNMTVRLQDDIPLRFDEFFSALSVIGRFEWMVVYLIIFLVVKRKILGGFITMGLFGLAHVVELVGKTVLEQPGPPKMFLRAQFGDFPGLHVFTEASYPSGHSLRIVFFTILIVATLLKARKLLLKKEWIQTIFKHDTQFLQNIGVMLSSRIIPLAISSGIVFLTFLVLVSRVSLGEHWTTDVIGGSFLGASFAFLALVFL